MDDRAGEPVNSGARRRQRDRRYGSIGFSEPNSRYTGICERLVGGRSGGPAFGPVFCLEGGVLINQRGLSPQQRRKRRHSGTAALGSIEGGTTIIACPANTLWRGLSAYLLGTCLLKDGVSCVLFASFPRCRLRAHFTAEPISSAGPATSENANRRHRACGKLLRNNHTRTKSTVDAVPDLVQPRFCPHCGSGLGGAGIGDEHVFYRLFQELILRY
jgi:hypothetical protein